MDSLEHSKLASQSQLVSSSSDHHFHRSSETLASSDDHNSSHQTLNSHKRNEYDAPTSNDPNSFQNLNVDSNSQLSLQVVPSNHQNHSSIPQALGSFGGESNVEGLKPENGHGAAGENVSLRTLIQKPLLSGSGTDKDYSGGEEETTSRRRRRSRWDPPPTEDGASSDGTVTGKRKRKSRWEDEPKSVIRLPDFMTGLTAGIDLDPEIQALNNRLLEISRKFQSGLPLDDRPEGARSPSPEPIYDNMGIRINTREYRARERLNRERQEIISQIIKKNPAFKPPADYRPPKLHKKLYIPSKEYPGYNFIGLIIGPRGNTQKRMERETGAKIVIRGKGSMKEGRFQQKKDLKYDPSENEELHVLVEAETQEALDAAAGMVEKLLQPVDEVLNEHKRQQLRELAALNGTIKDEEYCRLCGEAGHRQFACPSRFSTFKSDVLCKICGDGGHPTIDCPVKGTVGKKMDDEYQNFLKELGGTLPESSTKQSSTTLALGPGNSGSNPPWANGDNSTSAGSSTQAGSGLNAINALKEYDETNLYIGYLPSTLDDDGLIQLFSFFGEIVMAKVIKDRVTGVSKCYGFVKYSDVQQANNAIVSMNGYRLDGKNLAVRVAGKPPQPTVPPGPPAPPAPPMPMYPAPNQVPGSYPAQQPSPGALINAPPTAFVSAPVPWGPPIPTPYAAYPPPPPVSTLYAPVPGQPVPPYGVQYPPPVPTVSLVDTSQTVSSAEAQQSYPPEFQSQTSTPVQSFPSYVYGNSVSAFPASAQPAYPAPSFAYTSYCGVPPPPIPPPAAATATATATATSTTLPQSTVDHSQIIRNVPWASNPTVPPPASSAETTSNSADTEYEKFMGEMK